MKQTKNWREQLPSRGMPLAIGTFILIWLAYYILQMPLREFALHYSLDEFIERYQQFEMQAIITTSTTVFLTQSLGVYLICYYTYKRTSIAVTILSIFLLWLVTTGVRYLFDQVLFQLWFGFQNYGNEPSLFYYFADNVYWGGNYMMLGGVVYFVRFAFYSERKRSALEVQNRTTELAFLRSQVNPHFLFNTLNNLYSLIYSQSDNALKVVEKLSGLLRYSLYEAEATVPLQREIKYLYDFIELEKLRYNYPVALQIDLTEERNATAIPPFLFIPFVENAFKHGDLSDPHDPLRITLEWEEQTTEEWELHFFCCNKIKAKQKDKVGGIGLENVKKRLQLLYGDRYDLQIQNNDDYFTVDLVIPFNNISQTAII